jgi:hypothetical protein
MPALIASVRPLIDTEKTKSQDGVVLLLLRDPLWRNVATTRMLQEVFSLTKAEAPSRTSALRRRDDQSLCERAASDPSTPYIRTSSRFARKRLQERT